MDHPIETFMLAFDDATLGQYRATGPFVTSDQRQFQLPQRPYQGGYRATGPQVASGTWSFQSKFIPATSFPLPFLSQQLIDAQVQQKLDAYTAQQLSGILGNKYVVIDENQKVWGAAYKLEGSSWNLKYTSCYTRTGGQITKCALDYVQQLPFVMSFPAA
jgi:hypothetical protein